MVAPKRLYPGQRSISVVLDTRNLKQAALHKEFEASFGEKYARGEALDSPHYCSLSLFPGGGWKVWR